jgi:hypothetical protein
MCCVQALFGSICTEFVRARSAVCMLPRYQEKEHWLTYEEACLDSDWLCFAVYDLEDTSTSNSCTSYMIHTASAPCLVT